MCSGFADAKPVLGLTVNGSREPDRAPGGAADAWRFVVLSGLVSLFADLVYEGARRNIGPFS